MFRDVIIKHHETSLPRVADLEPGEKDEYCHRQQGSNNLKSLGNNGVDLDNDKVFLPHSL